jgi:hypothetical protein
MNELEEWIENQSSILEILKKDLVWQLSFEQIDWEFFRHTVNMVEGLQRNIMEKEYFLEIEKKKCE